MIGLSMILDYTPIMFTTDPDQQMNEGRGVNMKRKRETGKAGHREKREEKAEVELGWRRVREGLNG